MTVAKLHGGTTSGFVGSSEPRVPSLDVGNELFWQKPCPWPADSRSWENIHEEPQPGDSNRVADDPRVRMRWRGVRRRRRRIHDESVLRPRRSGLGCLCPGKPLDDAACD